MSEHENVSHEKVEHANVIIVGVDGSPSSLKALDWAATQAELTTAPPPRGAPVPSAPSRTPRPQPHIPLGMLRRWK